MLRFLDCFKDSEEWEHLVGTKDPHFSPAYYRAFGGGTLVDLNRSVVQPFHFQSENWIGNAYNFGGPLGPCVQARRFAFEFDEWKLQKGLNERCTLSLFDFHCPEQMNRHTDIRNVVVVDLTAPPYLRQTTKHEVAKATAAGVTTELVEPDVANSSIFEDLYIQSMKEKEAAPHWVYQAGFFNNVLKGLGPSRSALFLSKAKGEVVGGCLLIFDNKTCYYHWSGKKAGAGADHFQVWATINWSRAQGHRWFHLGGGLKPNDGLFTFKAGFSKLFFQARSYITKAEERVGVWL